QLHGTVRRHGAHSTSPSRRCPRRLPAGRARPVRHGPSAAANGGGGSARVMTILVTGGAGYIGSHMVHELVDAGEKVITLDSLVTGFDWAVAEGVPLIVGDTGDQELVASIIAKHDVDAIIHFAASTVVPESVAQPLAYYRNNTVNSRALIETAIKGGVKHFIFSSTAAVYGNPERTPVAEDAPPMPMSPYGASKLMTERMLRD